LISGNVILALLTFVFNKVSNPEPGSKTVDPNAGMIITPNVVKGGRTRAGEQLVVIGIFMIAKVIPLLTRTPLNTQRLIERQRVEGGCSG